MANPEGTQKKGISRRQFITLAGAGAVVGAVVLLATRNKGISGLFKSTTGSQNATGSQTNRATAGKYITTRPQSTTLSTQSFFSRLFGGKL